MVAALALHRTFLHIIPSPATSHSQPANGIEDPTIYKPFSFPASTHAKGMRSRRTCRPAPLAARADDSSAPSEMSVENALKVLGVREGASFDEILRAKSAIVASCKDDEKTIAQVEAAYDMLLMKSLNQRRSGKVANSNIRYADVKPAGSPGAGALPQWLKSAAKNVPISIESPSADTLGIQAGVYGALMVFTLVSGASTNSAGVYSGTDVPGLILVASFGASIYFLRKKSINLRKSTLMTAGGLVVGAVVGSAVENWLQVDIVPFFGIHSPAVIVSEFILLSQLLVSLYLR
ncbi:uncharacterized protein LOC110025481 [Phalaenopsis equestris]|uniref:uncharacterized protein LOC110025481 n=1 Tax=Phalaenopsis equestris TaxID=78828 RepID=UPI0009E47FD7|nr:uncharacterized protein LOC110025481 [Phalaenopsis equestris]